MGGPIPETGGKIEACSLHSGIIDLENTFDHAYLGFNNGIMQPCREFIDHMTGRWLTIGIDLLGITECLAFAMMKESIKQANQMSLGLELESGPPGPGPSHTTDNVQTHESQDVGTSILPALPLAQALTSAPHVGTSMLPTQSLTQTYTSAPDVGTSELAAAPLSLTLWSGLDDFVPLPWMTLCMYDFGTHMAIEPLKNLLAKYNTKNCCNLSLQAIQPCCPVSLHVLLWMSCLL